MNDFLDFMKDIYKSLQQTTSEIAILEEREQQLQSDYRTLKPKHLDFKKQFTNSQN